MNKTHRYVTNVTCRTTLVVPQQHCGSSCFFRTSYVCTASVKTPTRQPKGKEDETYMWNNCRFVLLVSPFFFHMPLPDLRGFGVYFSFFKVYMGYRKTQRCSLCKWARGLNMNYCFLSKRQEIVALQQHKANRRGGNPRPKSLPFSLLFFAWQKLSFDLFKKWSRHQ